VHGCSSTWIVERRNASFSNMRGCGAILEQPTWTAVSFFFWLFLVMSKGRQHNSFIRSLMVIFDKYAHLPAHAHGSVDSRFSVIPILFHAFGNPDRAQHSMRRFNSHFEAANRHMTTISHPFGEDNSGSDIESLERKKARGLYRPRAGASSHAISSMYFRVIRCRVYRTSSADITASLTHF